ncbi:MAG: transglutaminase domain-containing protein [Dehalococcoidales bacterium]|nr:MAG: transglutaminase domain-containing protein [Dehalococcoidales bacterium]
MTYRFGGRPSSINRTKRSHLWVWLQQEWMSVLLAFITLEIAILSIERANWLQSQPSLTFVLILSVVTGYILAKRQFHRLVNWSIVIAGGLLVTAWQTLSVLPPSELPWYERLGTALESFWGVVSMNRTDESSIHFVIFLVLFTWFLGYVSTWFVLRRKNAWGVVISGVVVLLINLSNLPSNYHGFLIFFLIFAMLLIGQVRLVKNSSLVVTSSTTSSYGITRFFVSSLLSISILAATITWLTPDITLGRIANIDADETPILENVEEYLTNFLAKVPRKQPFIAAEDQGEYLFNGNYERFGDDVRFVVTSDSPQYWRTWVYDIYKSSGWTNSEVIEYAQGQELLENEDEYLTGRKEITFDVEVLLKTDILLATGHFVSSDIPVTLHSLAPVESDSTDDQPASENIIAAVTPYTLDIGQKYQVTSSVISATPQELAEAGDDYPDDIKEYYLQLPESLPERVRILSANITANATTPYEKVLAIGANLSQFTYDLKADTPPEGVDAVEFFCFDEQSGACGDFATAMVVLLRSAGVPSRFSTGYRYGEVDPDSGKYVVLVSNRHAWAEVYFPGYGWVEFEATPGSGSPRGIVGVEAFTGGGGTTEYWDPYMYLDQYMTPSTVSSSSGYQSSSRASSLDTTSVALFWPFLFLIIGIPVAVILHFVFFRRRTPRDKRLSGTEYESEVYAGMCELAKAANLGPLPYQTPLEYCARLVSEFPLEKDSIQHILDAFLSRRYGPESSSDQSESMTWRLMRARRSVFDAIRERLKERGKRG